MDTMSDIPTVLIKKDDGAALRKLVARDADGVQVQVIAMRNVKGEYVHVGPCLKAKRLAAEGVEVGADGSTAAAGGGGGSALDREGGVLSVAPAGDEDEAVVAEVEYLTALFGGPTPRRAGPLAVADPIEACGPLNNAEAVKGAFVVVKRGGCMFADKSKNVEDAGGFATIVANTGKILSRMFSGELPADYTTLHTVMVSQDAGEKLIKVATGGAGEKKTKMMATLTPTMVKAAEWDVVGQLQEVSNWPSHDDDQRRLLTDLNRTHNPDFPTSLAPTAERWELLLESQKAARAYYYQPKDDEALPGEEDGEEDEML